MAFVVIFGMPGCSEPEPTTAQLHDVQISDQWLADRMTKGAIEFFEGDGVMENFTAPSNVDGDVILPLLRTLRDNFDLHSEVILEAPRLASGIVIDVTRLTQPRGDVVAVFEEADAEYPGLILEKWGNRWLSIHVYNQEEIKPIVDAGDLESWEEILHHERNAVRNGAAE